MNKKEILTIILLICVIFSLQAVVAADSGSNNADSTVLSVDNNVSSYALPSSDTDSLAEVANADSFTDLSGQLSGGSATLTKNYTYKDSDSGLGNGGITIDHDIIIEGNGNVIIDANHKSRIFNIAGGATVTLKGITFINAYANGNGGSILANGVVNIDNCKFINSTAYHGNGGAVFVAGFKSTITNSYFEANHAVNSTAQNGFAGAVALANANITVSNSNFTKNIADQNGGAVMVIGAKRENITIDHSVFTYNEAGRNGGALGWAGNCAYGNIIGSTFEHNKAHNSAGAMGIQSDYINIYNSTFRYNEAIGDRYEKQGSGGAVVFRGGDGYAFNCSFTENVAKMNGGAIYVRPVDGAINDHTGYELCNFTDNTAGKDGGAVGWYEGSINGYLDNCIFDNNTAKGSGGAILWNGEHGNVSYCNFTNNRALGTALDSRASVNAVSDVLVVNDTDWVSASQDTYNHKLYVKVLHDGQNNKIGYELYVTDIDGSTYSWNLLASTNNVEASALDWGGDVYFGGNGGTIIWSGDNGIIDNCIVYGSNSARRGGGAYMTGSDNVSVTNSKFINGTSGTNGGALDWLAGANYGRVINCTFIDNRAARSAGTIYYDGNYGIMENITIRNSYAYGGSLKHSDDKLVNYTGWDLSHWDTNTTGGDAGAIMFTGSHILVYNATFVNCTATGRGGAIFLQDNTNVTFDLCRFANNTALGTANNTYNDDKNVSSGLNILHTGWGGAIAFDIGASYGTIKNSKFVNNTAARDGGAIDFAAGSSYSTIYNSTFENNTAMRSGGAFYWDGSYGNVSYCNFTNNRALGTALQYDMPLSYENIVVVNKTMPQASVSTMNRLYILDNSTSKSDIRYKSYVTVKNGDSYEWLLLDEIHIVNDDAPSPTDWGMDEFFGGDGGTILWGGDVGIVDHCNFVDSNSARRGGGAYMRGSDNITFSNCNFTNSTSGTNGGALDWLAGANYGKVINSTFVGNRAARSAGTLYYDGNYGEFINITVRDSYAYGGSLKYSDDKLVEYAGWDSSHWDTNTTGGDAGAIMITGDHVYLYNATFVNCTATGRGGAVFLQDNNNITFDLCKFANNTALGIANNTYNDDKDVTSGLNRIYTGNGGAIGFDVGASNGVIKNSKFANNTAARNGGAISFYTGSSYVTIFNSTFDNNTAKRSGGALFWDGTYGNVSYCNFTNNRATGTALQYDMVLTYDDIVVVEKTMPVASDSTMGKLYILDNSTSKADIRYKSYVTVKNGDSYEWLQLDQTHIVNDDAPSPTDWGMDQFFGGNGGTILWGGDHAVIDHCNIVDSNSARRGGGAYMRGSDNITFSNCNFTNSTSGTNGGALDWLAGANYGKVINATFTGNRATRSAGTLYYDGNYGEFINITVRDSYAYGGSLKYSDDKIVKYAGWDSSHWDTNTTGGDAGAIMITGDHVYLYNATFVNCTATGRGGAVFLQDNNNVTFDLCRFANNTALGTANNTYNDDKDVSSGLNRLYSGSGGAIAFDMGASNGVIKNSKFVNNTAERNGGAICFYEGSTNSTIYNSTFDNNTAKRSGGAFYWDGSNGNISYSNFTNNRATGTALQYDMDVSYENVEVVNKTMPAASASTMNKLYILDNSTSKEDVRYRAYVTVKNGDKYEWLLLNEIHIVNDDVPSPTDWGVDEFFGGDGGTILWGGNVGVVDHCNFVDSNSARRGGAVYMKGSDNITFSNSNFTNCTSGTNGGALDWLAGANYGKVINATFIDNRAARSAGTLYYDGNYGQFINITVKNSYSYGGSLDNSSDGIVAYAGWDSSHWDTNTTGGDAGAIMITGDHVYLYNATFINCTSTGRGGAVFLQDNYNVTFDLCKFENNTALGIANNTWKEYKLGHDESNNDTKYDYKLTGHGGAIGFDVNAEEGVIKNSEFINNYARRDGGAINYATGSFNGTIENTKFINNSAGDDGGAINWEGNVGIIKNITCYNNTGTAFADPVTGNSTSKGGTICLTGNNVTITDSNFTLGRVLHNNGKLNETDAGAIFVTGNYSVISNTVFDRCYSPNNAGAIEVIGNHTKIDNCTFENCNASENGGAIYVSGIDFRLSNSSFTNDTAGVDGGSVYIIGASSVISSSNFTDSVAYEDGGAMYWQGEYGKVISCIFKHNEAASIKHSDTVTYYDNPNSGIRETKYDITGGDGGAIIWLGSHGLIENCTFYNNTAAYDGGAMFIQRTSTDVTCNNTTIKDCIFELNDAGINGGAINWASGAYNCTLIGSTLNDNMANRSGGAIYVNGQYISVIDSEFNENNVLGTVEYDNRATGSKYSTLGGNGGAVIWIGSYGLVDNGTFTKNTAKVEGGALYAQGASGSVCTNMVIENSVFEENEAVKTGGAISFSMGAQNATLFNSLFDSNIAAEGGAVYVTGDNTNISESTFEDNNALNNGGAIYVKGANTVINGSDFDNCTVDSTGSKGGAIYIEGIKTTVVDSTFENCEANIDSGLGGSIYIKGNNAKILGSKFNESSAYQGGVIYLEGSYCNVSDSLFSNSYASKDGGAMYSTGSDSGVYFSNFTANEAEYDGGGVYWYGGSASKYNSVIGCIFTENVAHAKGIRLSTRTTFGGGGLYWSEGGFYGTLRDSKFYNNSVQSNQKADGGGVLWDKSSHGIIDNCIFEGNYITSTCDAPKTSSYDAPGDMWVQGGALFLRATRNFTISNCDFKNSSSDGEGGAIYLSNTGPYTSVDILVVNSTFSDNVALGKYDVLKGKYGGGAIYLKESYNVKFVNLTFTNNTANVGGALSVYDTRNTIARLYDCTFENNHATNNGGGIWYSENTALEGSFYLYDSIISGNDAVNYGGGVYAAFVWHMDNVTVINNTARYGGGMAINRVNATFDNMEFVNNTATSRGGGIYVTSSGVTISNFNLTGNKAVSGSAIGASNNLTLINVYLDENQAESSSLRFLNFNKNTGAIEIQFRGMDKYLNAIYPTGSNVVYCTNVTYWGAGVLENTGSTSVTLSGVSDPTNEVGQNITVSVYDENSNLLAKKYFITDLDGKVSTSLSDLVPDLPTSKYNKVYLESELTNDIYYTYIKTTTRTASQINASVDKTVYHMNSTLNVNVTAGATGNVSVYLNDTFLGNITLNNAAKGSINISTLIDGKYLPAGNYTLSVVYNGNLKYDVSNTTAILEIARADTLILFNVTIGGYDMTVNVTVVNANDNINDTTGNVTVNIRGQNVQVELVNGSGTVFAYNLPSGIIPIYATYSGDKNYLSSNNYTTEEIFEKKGTFIAIEVNAHDIMVNETIQINVTVTSGDGSPINGNITIILDNVEYNVTLNNSKASFNKTGLSAGQKIVSALFEGSDVLAPSYGIGHFNVNKYDAFVNIDVNNVTIGSDDVINITVPGDAKGTVNVAINGTEFDYEYILKINNGTVIIPLSSFGVDVYNITVTFEDDNYKFTSNSTLFNVSKVTPSISIDVENVTYGNKTIIVVTLPDRVTGNVTLTINDTLVVFDEEALEGGRATFEIENLPAGNYTINATYNGDDKNAISTEKVNFTVNKADVELDITVENIPYGDVEAIVVTVKAKGSAQGNVTITVAGNTTTINLGEEKTWVLRASATFAVIEDYDGTAKWNIENLAVGTYPVSVTYNGNENFNALTKETSFAVYKVNTTLDVDVHDIFVWDKESINVTLADNATGNVIININGVNHTAKINNGIAQLNLTNLTVGHQVVWVFYDGDKNYSSNRSMVEFDVKQRTPAVNVTALNVTTLENGKITINIPSNATGYVIVTGNFTNYQIRVDEFNSGKVELPIEKLANGTYSVHIKYYGEANDNYTTAENDTTFKVSKANVDDIAISVEDIVYGQAANITVTVTPDATGYITIRINETRKITLPIVDGKVNWIVDGLAANNYTVYANYSGDAKYDIINTDKAFEVGKADPDLTIETFSCVVYEDGTIEISINDETYGGKLNITVDGIKTSVDIPADGKLSFKTQALNDYGKTYDILVEYGGNENFTADTATLSAKLNKITTYGINVTGMNITVGEDEIITVEVPDHVDDVVIWVNGTSFRNHSFTGNKATFNITELNLKKGVYTVTATVNDTEFEHMNFTSIFTVDKTYIPMNITVFNNASIYVGDTVKIIVSVPEDATENVTIEINNIKLTNVTVNGNVTFYVPAITYGNKTVVAAYVGDDRYYYNSTTANFTVNKRASQVNVTATGNTVGNGAVITVKVPANATGYVTVNVNGTDYTVNLTSGEGRVEIAGLGNGTYYVHATYLGDDQYNPSTNNTKTFEMVKNTPEIAIKVENVTYGNHTIIEVSVSGASGNVTIKINDTDKGEFTLVNGKVVFDAGVLAADNYTVNVVYKGDGKYAVGSADKDFNVSKATPTITINNVTVDALTNAGVIVTINTDASGTLNITVNNKNYTAPIISGVATFTVDKLPVGEYDIVANYTGNDNYAARSVTLADGLNVTKVQTYEMNVTAVDVGVGKNTTITINVPKDATGTVTVWVNGTKLTNSTIVEGVATVYINQTREGRYEVNATLTDDKYADQTVFTAYWVSKVETPMTITVVDKDNIKVGDGATITVTLPDDIKCETVTIEINGEKYTNTTVDGVATFNVKSLTNGNKTVVASYAGNNKYLANSTTANFTVTKRSSQVNVTVDSPINVGDNATITVKVPANATGYVIVNVNGINHTVNLTGGEGSAEITGLKSQTYKVTVTYIGDDQYLSSINNTQEIKVNKVASTINITVSDDGIIDNGSDVNITMKLPSDATGKVIVTLLNGTEIIKSYAVFANEGNAFLHLDTPAIGLYNVTAEYLGDDKYLGSKNSTEFDVYRTGKELSVFTHDVAVNVNGTIEVALGGRHIGNVTIIISNASGEIIKENASITTGNAISTADFTLPLLDAGNYHVRAVYIETDGARTIVHEGTGTFNVHKLPSHISIEKLNDTIFVGENETIKLAIELDSRANDGNISVFVNGVEYNTTTSDLTIEISGLNATDYEVKAIFHGNNWYEESNASATFKVVKNPTIMDVKVTNSTGGSVEQINVTFLDDVSGQVLLDIDGQHYYANITGGIAQFNITGLKAKEYEFNVTYLGDNKYLANNTNSNLKISKVQPSLTVDVENKTVGESEKIIVHLPDNATGYVVIDVDGTKYHVDIVKSQEIALTISNLENKTYDVKVTYSGDDYYENATSSDKFNVSKIKSEITVKVEDVTVGDVAVVNITVTPGATGNVTVTIGNEFKKTVGIVDGTISIVVPDLTVGDKTVDVTYNGDEKYLPNVNSTTFSVGKLNITSNTEIIDNGNGTVTIIVPENATGNVTIYVDGKNFTGNISNGISVITLNNVTPGKHDISVAYSGDENHANATAKSSVTIPKLDSPISLNVTDIKVGDAALINVSSPTGDVTIEINGKSYAPVSFENGIAKFIVENLSYGNKTVSVTYAGNSNYTGNFTTANFTVSKRNSSVKVNVSDIIVRDIAYINVTVPNNATGIVTVNVGGNNYTVNVTDGQGTLQVKGLGNGTYNVVATYMGDDQYLSSVNDTQSFNVNKVPSDIGITVSHEGIVPNGSDVDITITAPIDATGKVEVIISNGLENISYTVYVHDGVGQLHLETPEIAIYNVTAKYLGDDKYNGSENKTEFDVYPTGKELAVDTEPISVSDQENILIYASGNHVGNDVMVIIRDAQGNIVKEENVTFNSYYESPFNGSSARLKLDSLPAGDYDVEAIYLEKDGVKTVEHTGLGHFKVSKLNSTLSIKEIRNVTVGENVTIELEINPGQATGNISVFVNGVEYKTNTSALTITIPNLAAEEYIVHALYYGNHDFNASNASSAFKVSKLNPEITVNATGIDVGDKVLIEITAPEDIKLPVLVDVDGVGYYVNMTEGKGSLYVPNLESGDYNVTVRYLGDDKYLEAKNTTSFKVSKVTSSVNVTVENITVGENAVINIETPEDLCGNVTVSVDGENYTVPVSGGKGTLVLSDLNVGNHTVDVAFDGCKKYEPSNTTAKFNVAKIKTDETDIKLIDQGNGTVVVIVPDNVTGNVTVKVGDKEFNATVVNGTAVVTLDNVTPGTHEVEVIYSGDGTHDSISTKSNVTVPKYDSPMNVTVGEIKSGENGTVVVKLPDGAGGNVTVYVDGKAYPAEVVDGGAVVTVGNLTAGLKTVVVEYSGDGNYSSGYAVGNFTVEPSKVVPDVKVINQGNGTVVVVVPDNVTGNVTVKVGDKEFNATVVNGTAVVTLDNVTPGTHEVEVIYSGDDAHTNATLTTSVTAPKYDSVVDVAIGEAKEGEPTVITVTVPDDATGNVTVSVGGKEYVVAVENGTAKVIVENLTGGNHTIVVEYSGDENYSASHAVSNLTVEKADIIPEMIVDDYGNGTVVIVVGNNATGNVTVKIGNNSYNATVINGTAVVTLDNVTPGTHEVEVIYSGDDTHTNATVTTSVTAPKYDSPMNVAVGEIMSGENGTVVVKLPDGAGGNVTVYVDGKAYPAEVVDGGAVVTVGNLTAGLKTVVVEYSGDGNYSSGYAVGNFTVEPSKFVPDVKVIDLGNGTVVVVVCGNATGNVTVKVGDKEFNAAVENGTATIDVDNLTLGTNEIQVIYSGDDARKGTTLNTTINAPKYETPISVNVSDISEGETATITVTLPENATGNVTVTVDGKSYPAEIKDGIASVSVDNLTGGPKSVIVEYSGDNNYNNNYSVANFTVEKAKVAPDVKVIDQGNGTVIVVVGDNATGNVTVKVGNDTYNATVVNGTAIINLDDVAPGEHEIEIKYGGDDTHSSTTAKSKVSAPKYESPLDVTTSVTNVGDNAVITVNVPEDATGDVTIEIDGEKYTAKAKDGVAKFEIANLTAGTKTVAVEYSGDENYASNHTTANITVSKCSSNVNATIEDINVGDEVLVTVHVPNDATGQVLIDIDGVGYYVNVTDGVGSTTIPRMPDGIYDVNLTYVGDDKYLPSTNKSSFNVNKVPSFVIPTAEDIYVGDVETIKLTVPTDATGNVTVVIDGEEYNFNLDDGVLAASDNNGKYVVAISGGNGELVISGLSEGDYTVSVKYNGDDKYLPSTNTTTFKVLKSNSSVDVIDKGNGTVKVQIGDNASGTVQVKVGNQTYNATVVNGEAVVQLTDATPGTHEIEVTYSGDDNHSGKTVKSSITIPQHECPISVETHDIYVGETETVIVTVPEDATGTITIEINGKEYSTSDIVDGKAIFNVTGLNFGNKTVAVKYSGDKNYRDNYTTGQFVVEKVTPTVKATPKNIKVEKDEVITITLPSDATGRVLVEVNGVGYYADIVNGKAKVVISDLPAGKYVATIFYEGDDKYSPFEKFTETFTVSKTKSPVSSTGDIAAVGEDAKITIKLPSDATGTVTIKVGGKTYTAEVKDGKAIFSVPNLNIGKHDVYVYYSGDKKYDANFTVTYVVIEDNGESDVSPSYDASSNEGISLSVHATGNPVWILLLLLLTVVSTQIRRFRK